MATRIIDVKNEDMKSMDNIDYLIINLRNNINDEKKSDVICAQIKNEITKHQNKCKRLTAELKKAKSLLKDYLHELDSFEDLYDFTSDLIDLYVKGGENNE